MTPNMEQAPSDGLPSPAAPVDIISRGRRIFLTTANIDLTSWPPGVESGPDFFVEIPRDDEHLTPASLILRGPVSRVREQQIAHTLYASYVDGAYWPPSFNSDSKVTLEDVVWEHEKSDEPVGVKNAWIVSMMAIARELELSYDPQNIDTAAPMKSWNVEPHISMLNAIGASLVGDLALSEESLRMAALLHRSYRNPGHSATEDPYASPGVESILKSTKDTIGSYAGLDWGDEKGIALYTSHELLKLDGLLSSLPPGLDALGLYAENEEYLPMLGVYGHILGEIDKLRSAFLGREEELDLYLHERYEIIAKVQREREKRHEVDDVRGENQVAPPVVYVDLDGYSQSEGGDDEQESPVAPPL